MLYEGFVTLVPDEQAVQELLSHFPARDVEEPVTKDHLRAEMADLRTELRGEMAELRTELERMVRSFQAWTIGAVASVGSLVVLAEKFLE